MVSSALRQMETDAKVAAARTKAEAKGLTIVDHEGYQPAGYVELDGAVTEFRDRRLDHIDFPYVFVDATYVKAHDGARVVSKAIIVATGVSADGNREVLGLAVGDSEDKAFWTASSVPCGPEG